MSRWERRVSMPDGSMASYEQHSGAKYIKLVVSPITQSILPDVSIEALGYNGATPGPLIVVNQGEWVILEVENRSEEPTSLHVHGLTKPNEQDGIPQIEPSPPIKPGHSLTYQFQAWQAGTFFYHAADPLQVNLGLIGGFIVLPSEAFYSRPFVPDHDYTLILQEWQLEQNEIGQVSPGLYRPNRYGLQPNFFTINGKCFPATSPLYTHYGNRLRVRFINKSNDAHTMHIHGHDFQVVSVNGFTRKGWMDDTINIASGQRFDIEFHASNPGVWPINGTKTFHQTNNGVSPGGMMTRLIYLERLMSAVDRPTGR
ncbi:multicopper oxidase family protein [Brevibacillus dissolubilis]|uniref:multicopper oxidase family protein n=1 Tax=Brevibacillus dissolubilis TaxID=1844116 RepID=UPI001117327A|nr:multicopper oxidase domain-containing protein [Brevibacillus dissolubilis]